MSHRARREKVAASGSAVMIERLQHGTIECIVIGMSVRRAAPGRLTLGDVLYLAAAHGRRHERMLPLFEIMQDVPFWKIMRTTARPIRVEETAAVELPRSATTMWSFIADPASTVEFDESTEVGVILPGSPSGLGEIQVFIQRTAGGRIGSLLEVIEFEPGRRAVTRTLDSPNRYGTVTVEPLGPDRCRLTQRLGVDVPAGAPAGHVRMYHEAYKQQLRSMMARLTELAPGLPD
jgi:hypothetical protein